MKTFKHYLRLAAAIGILSFTLALTTADLTPLFSAVPAPVAQVFVTNDAANPVPTAAQGTTTVGGTVSAQQSGVWKVDVNGTTLVRDVDQAARNRYNGGQLLSSIQDGADSSCASGFAGVFEVPAGKRLVIEYVSGTASALAGQPLTMSLGLPGGVLIYSFLPSKWAGDGTRDFFVLSQATRLYADSGPLTVCASRVGTNGSAPFNLTVSGHLVDFP
jgi:hypothetical protein